MNVLVNFLPALKVESGAYVLGVDLGTTTIAMCLMSPRGEQLGHFCRVNPQGVWGQDVLSRIQASAAPIGARELQACVRRVLEEGVGELLELVSEPDRKLRIVLAGNATMMYLFMGWDAAELGCAPFRVSHTEVVRTELLGYPAYGFPPLSAFVGGDITAGIWATDLWKSDKPVLLLDLGTNGELVLGNREKILACATAAGPAFEGGPCKGIWGADMVSLTAVLRRRGLVDETGLLAAPYFETGIKVGGVTITQQSIRALQLAKGAIHAGIEILLEEYGITASAVDKVILAGGLGYFLKPADVACIGLLPRELADKAVAGGNTALLGACLAGGLLEQLGPEAVEAQWQDIGKKVTTLNLAECASFEEKYLSQMYFPDSI